MTQLLTQQITTHYIQLCFMGMNPIFIERPEGDKEDEVVQEYEKLYSIAMNCLENKNWDAFLNYINPQVDISQMTKNDNLKFENGTITHYGYTLQNGLVVRIIEICKQDALDGENSENNKEVINLVKMLGKLMKNPSKRVVNKFWDYLSRNKVPFTEDGNIILYGQVDENNLLNGLNHNKKMVIEAPRNMVDDVNVDEKMHLTTFQYVSKNNDIGVYIVNPKNVVYVGHQRISVCKMKQVDLIKGQ